MSKQEFIDDLKNLIEKSEDYEKTFLKYYEKYTADDNLIPEIREFKKDEMVLILIDKLESTYLRIRENI